MPYIKVNISRLKNYSSELALCRAGVSRIQSDFYAYANNLDWDISSVSNIKNRTRNIVRDLDTELTSLGKMETFFYYAVSQYLGTESASESEEHMARIPTEVGHDVTEKNIGTEQLEFSVEETEELIAQMAREEGVSKDNIVEDLKEGLEPAQKWISKIEKYIGKSEKVLRYITGATDVSFSLKNGQIIVSQFTRSSVLNKITKFFHGKGIATHYKPTTLMKTPGIGTLYTINKVANTLEMAAGIAEGVIDVLEAGSKIADVLNDSTMSASEKACDITAIGVTSAAAAALEVAAPIAGKAVTTAVTALIPIPGVNVVAGAVAGIAVKGVIDVAAEVLTSEAVVSQVSDSIANVGEAVAAGAKTISDAGKNLLESKTVGDAVANTAKLVGTTITAGVNTVTTVIAENVKVVETVVVETVKATANKVVDTGKKVVNWFKSW